MQEELVADIADAFMSEVNPIGCIVKATGKHGCVAARGVRRLEAAMTTVASRGVFQEGPKYIAEFYQAIGWPSAAVR